MRLPHPLRLLAYALIGVFFPMVSSALESNAVKGGLKTVSDSSAASYLTQLTLGLMLVLLAIAALAWVMRRAAGLGRGANGALRVIAAVAVGQRERVVLVQVGKTQLVLGVAPGNVRTLHTLDTPLEPAQAVSHAGDGFSARLSAAIKGRLS